MRRKTGIGAAPDKTPVVLSLKDSNARIVYALDTNAARAGLKTGMALASARAVVNAVHVVEADLPADRAMLDVIADWCDRYSPFVALDPPHGLLIDITGVDHLFGGEQAMLSAIRRAFRDQGFLCYGAIAGTEAAARALARFANGTIAAAGDDAATTAPLPTAALDLGEKDTHALVRAGLKTIGMVAERTRNELMARFGKEMVFKLERALGLREKPISPRRILPAYAAERRFAEPVVSEDFIADAILGLATSLTEVMEERGQGARLLEASFFRTDGAVRRVEVETARALRDPAVIAKLFRTRLDALADQLDPGFGFDLVRLAAVQAERLVPETVGLDAKPDDEKEIACLIDRLAARFGSHRMLLFQPQDTHIPEAAGVAVPAQHADDTDLDWQVRADSEPPRRPVRMFAHPELIDVFGASAPDGAPPFFTWRSVRHRVVRAEGPERIAMEWWQTYDHKPERDYFRVEDESGQRFWLFREGLYMHGAPERRWFMHGLFA